MKGKEILDKIRAAFLGEPAPAPAPAPIVAPVAAMAPTPFKLKDGTDITIAIEDPAVSMVPDAGDMVTIGGVPATAGDYELEDGSTFTVDATGMISVYTAAAPVTQPDFNAPPVLTLEERLSALEAKISGMQAPAVPLGMATEVQLQAASEKIDKHEETIKGLFELCEVLVNEPTADPKTITGAKKEGFLAKKEERMELRANALRELKNKKEFA